MNSDVVFFIELAVSFLPFLLFAILNGKANTKKEFRNRQYPMPAVAVVYSVVLLVLLDKLSAIILELFLQEQKKELLKKEGNLSRAIFEYNFANKVPQKENASRKKFDIAVKVIEKLIVLGIEEGDLYCEDPRGAARNMMYVIEGLRISSQTIGITEETVNREIRYLMRRIKEE